MIVLEYFAGCFNFVVIALFVTLATARSYSPPTTDALQLLLGSILDWFPVCNAAMDAILGEFIWFHFVILSIF